MAGEISFSNLHKDERNPVSMTQCL